MSQPQGSHGADEPARVLADLPSELWHPLLRAVRRAVDRLPRAELPAGLRPFAGWKPERLAGQRPRQAIAQALADDPVLREHVGEALHDRSAYDAAGEVDPGRLTTAHGDATAIAALAARGQWEALATVAAGAAERLAAASRVAAQPSVQEADAGEATESDEDARRRLEGELASVIRERDAQRRRADAAEQRLQQAEADRAELRATLETLHSTLAERDEQISRLRKQADKRVARLHRRVERAEARARVDDARVAEVADALDELAARLRGALASEGERDAPAAAAERPDQADAVQQTGGPATTVPRGVPPAEPGRPCILPPGLVDGTAAAVRALLQAPRLQVIVDGYNVTMSARPGAALDDQRRWLVQVASAVVARFGRLVTLVFDGTDPSSGQAPSARGVRVVFTAGEETADERIVTLVEDLPGDAPVLVVSGDREVASACRDLGVNVTGAEVFVEAVEG